MLPYLATSYVFHVFANYIADIQLQSKFRVLIGEDPDDSTLLTLELHAISSAGKAVYSWIARDGIQECREACGAHGFLKGKNLLVTQVTECVYLTLCYLQ